MNKIQPRYNNKKKHSFGNSLLRDFFFYKIMKLHKKKNLPLKLHICTHTCFLLDKTHIKPPFKNAKDLTFKKII